MMRCVGILNTLFCIGYPPGAAHLESLYFMVSGGMRSLFQALTTNPLATLVRARVRFPWSKKGSGQRPCILL